MLNRPRSNIQSSFGNLPTSVLNDPNNPTHAISPSSWGNLYDTPTLFFVNPSSYQITNTQMVLTVTPQVNSGWNTLNNGLTQTINLGTLAANAITQLAWGTGGSLFLYDLPDILYQRVCELIT